MRKITQHVLLAWALLLLGLMCVTIIGPAPAQAVAWKAKYERISAEAGETLSPGDVVCIASNGTAWKADADNSALRPAIGMVGDKGGAAGTTVEIVTRGIVRVAENATEAAKNTPGSRWWLQTVAGTANATNPIATTGNATQPIGLILPGGYDLLLSPMLPIQ